MFHKSYQICCLNLYFFNPQGLDSFINTLRDQLNKIKSTILSYGKRRSRALLMERLGSDMVTEFEVCKVYLQNITCLYICICSLNCAISAPKLFHVVL